MKYQGDSSQKDIREIMHKSFSAWEVCLLIWLLIFGRNKHKCCVCGWPAEKTLETHYQKQRHFCKEHLPI